MLTRLKQIAAEEKAGLSDASLALIVRQAEGGMRDALSLLDQVMSACGPRASDATVAEALGAIDRTIVQQMAAALIRRDAKTLLDAVEDVFMRGADLRRLAEELALELRHVLVTRATGKPPAELAEVEQKMVVDLAREATRHSWPASSTSCTGPSGTSAAPRSPGSRWRWPSSRRSSWPPPPPSPSCSPGWRSSSAPVPRKTHAPPSGLAGRPEVVPLPSPFASEPPQARGAPAGGAVRAPVAPSPRSVETSKGAAAKPSDASRPRRGRRSAQ
jgi:hypothetical protein